jgi:hypothetical protein
MALSFIAGDLNRIRRNQEAVFAEEYWEDQSINVR